LRRPPRSTLFPYTTLFRSIFDRALALPAPVGGDALAFAGVLAPQIVHRGGDARQHIGELIGVGIFAGQTQLVPAIGRVPHDPARSEEHTSELQSRENLVCR